MLPPHHDRSGGGASRQDIGHHPPAAAAAAATAPAAADPTSLLVERARAGDQHAFRELHAAYAHRARGLARRLVTNVADADDAVAHAFAATFVAIQRGGGPTSNFPAYLFSAVRNFVMQTARARAVRIVTAEWPLGTEPVAPVADEHDPDHPVLAALERLPTRWREVLWAIDVDGVRTADLAERMSMTPNALAALTLRARRGLREAVVTPPAEPAAARRAHRSPSRTRRHGAAHRPSRALAAP